MSGAVAIVTTYLAIAAGGAVGGALRYLLGSLVDRRHTGRFPWGTLLVNISGALVAGALAAAFAQAGTLNTTASAALLIGVCGSYTTVSSFSLQALTLMQSGHAGRAALYVLLSVTGCLLAVAAGHGLALSLVTTGVTA